MKLFFDTSVLVAAMVAAHPKHELALPSLQHAKAEGSFFLATHTLAELYAVLTTLPVSPRITPGAAQLMIKENIMANARPVVLTAKDYRLVLSKMADLGMNGGIIYNALIAQAAHKSGADRLLTFNLKHFLQVWPEGQSRIMEP